MTVLVFKLIFLPSSVHLRISLNVAVLTTDGDLMSVVTTEQDCKSEGKQTVHFISHHFVCVCVFFGGRGEACTVNH